MSHRNNISFIDRSVGAGGLQPVSLAYPENLERIRQELYSSLGRQIDKDSMVAEIRLHQSLARAAASTGAVTLKWAEARNIFSPVEENEHRWSFDGFWTDIRNLIVAAAFMHGVELYVAWGTSDANGNITGGHYSSPKLFENRQDAPLFEEFARCLLVPSPSIPSSKISSRQNSPMKHPRTFTQAVTITPQSFQLSDKLRVGSSPSSKYIVPSRNLSSALERLNIGGESSTTSDTAFTPFIAEPRVSQAGSSSAALPSKKKANTSRLANEVIKMVVSYVTKLDIPADIRGDILVAFTKKDGNALETSLAQVDDEDIIEVLREIFENAFFSL